MEIIFYIAAIIAILSTAAVVTRKNAVHALLYLIVSLLSVAVVFYVIGAPYLAALEVMVYAGAIMVLFVFVIMMLNMGKSAQASSWFSFKYWIGPAILSLILLIELGYIFSSMPAPPTEVTIISPKAVGQSLFGPYIIGVELVGMLLLAGVVGAYHIGYKKQREYHRFLKDDKNEEEQNSIQ